jgi:transcriptional regulator with PAS, ATPase and Fis domain
MYSAAARRLELQGGAGIRDPRHIDVRVLAASNRDIEQAVEDGLLRADLYYRLNVFTIQLPPCCANASKISRN